MPKINRQYFYQTVRENGLFSFLKQSQVDGIEAILNGWEYWVSNKWVDDDLRKLAYMFATVYHECNKTMQPIQEYGGEKYFVRRYWDNLKIRNELGNKSPQDAINFSGKGFVQLTGRANFTRMGKLIGEDLINHPTKALEVEIATAIMFEGMNTGKSFRGDFTGKSLQTYFSKTTNDPINARRIINGIDKAKLISGYHYKFLAALKY